MQINVQVSKNNINKFCCGLFVSVVYTVDFLFNFNFKFILF